MKNYSIVKTKKFALQNMKLISLREEDIEKIRVWRNQQRSILRQNKIITKKNKKIILTPLLCLHLNKKNLK